MPSRFGSHALSHFHSRICSGMAVRDHVLLMLGFSARAGSCPARLDRAAASMWQAASQGVCTPMGKPLSPGAIRMGVQLPHGDERVHGGALHPAHSPVLPRCALSSTGMFRRMR